MINLQELWNAQRARDNDATRAVYGKHVIAHYAGRNVAGWIINPVSGGETLLRYGAGQNDIVIVRAADIIKILEG